MHDKQGHMTFIIMILSILLTISPIYGNNRNAQRPTNRFTKYYQNTTRVPIDTYGNMRFTTINGVENLGRFLKDDFVTADRDILIGLRKQRGPYSNLRKRYIMFIKRQHPDLKSALGSAILLVPSPKQPHLAPLHAQLSHRFMVYLNQKVPFFKYKKRKMGLGNALALGLKPLSVREHLIDAYDGWKKLQIPEVRYSLIALETFRIMPSRDSATIDSHINASLVKRIDETIKLNQSKVDTHEPIDIINRRPRPSLKIIGQTAFSSSSRKKHYNKYYTLQNRRYRKVLILQDKALLRTENLSKRTHQAWFLQTVSSAWVTIRHKAQNKCLALLQANGQYQLQAHSCKKSKSRHWKLIPLSKHYYLIQNRQEQRCIALHNKDNASLESCSKDNKSLQWRLIAD